MVRYCLFSGPTPQGNPRSLPRAWANISNFHSAPPEVILAHEWLKYTHVEPDPDQVVLTTAYVRAGDICTVEYTYRAYSVRELERFANRTLFEKVSAMESEKDAAIHFIAIPLIVRSLRGDTLTAAQRGFMNRVANDNRVDTAFSMLGAHDLVVADIQAGVITTPGQVDTDNRWP